jgi:hypothetical protein
MTDKTLCGALRMWRVKFEAIQAGSGGVAPDILAAVLVAGGHLNEFRRSAEIIAMMMARGGAMALQELRRLSEFMPQARSLVGPSRTIEEFVANLHQHGLKHQTFVFAQIQQEAAWQAFVDSITEAAAPNLR